MLNMFLLQFLFLCICSEYCLGGDPYYVAEWSDVIKSCPDFDNKYFSCDDVELGSSQANDDDDAGLAISGKLVFIEAMEDGITADLQVFKSTELGDEPMYAARADFCSTLSDADTPWHPLVATFNSSSCPIPMNEYSLDGLKISIDFAKEVLTHENCGEYRIRLAMMDNMDMVSCHMLSMAVVEKYDDDK